MERRLSVLHPNLSFLTALTSDDCCAKYFKCRLSLQVRLRERLHDDASMVRHRMMIFNQTACACIQGLVRP